MVEVSTRLTTDVRVRVRTDFGEAIFPTVMMENPFTHARHGLRGSVRLAGRREADCPADPIETSESLAPTSLSFLSIAESAWLLLWHLGASVKAAHLSSALQNSCSLAVSPGTGCKY